MGNVSSVELDMANSITALRGETSGDTRGRCRRKRFRARKIEVFTDGLIDTPGRRALAYGDFSSTTATALRARRSTGELTRVKSGGTHG